MFADAEPARAIIFVAVAHEVKAPHARHHTHTESGEPIVVPHDRFGSRLEAFDSPLGELDRRGFWRRAFNNLAVNRLQHSYPDQLDGWWTASGRHDAHKAASLLSFGRLGRLDGSRPLLATLHALARSNTQPISCTHRAHIRDATVA